MNDIYDKTNKRVGRLDGPTLYLDGMEFSLVNSRKRSSGWRFYGLFGTHWRLGCKTYSREMQLILRQNCKYNSFDMAVMDTVARIGDVFLCDSLFV